MTVPRMPPGSSRPGNASGTPYAKAMKTTSAGTPRKNSMIAVAIHRYGPTGESRISASSRPNTRPNRNAHAV